MHGSSKLGARRCTPVLLDGPAQVIDLATRRDFGSVRRLPSGRWQARYPDGAGRLVPAEDTFATRAEAGRYLDHVRVQRDQGTWVDPNRGRVSLAEYSETWLRQRDVRPRTRELYAGLLDHHILPSLGSVSLNRLSPAAVRSWFAELRSGERPGRSTAAKSYRLLSTILKTAVEDELIAKSPCILKNAGVERPAERPVASVDQVLAIADAIDPRFRALVLLATFGGLRLGELQALTKRRLDLEARVVSVSEQTQLLKDGTLVTGPPKSAAGVRVVNLPEAIIGELRRHVQCYSGQGPDGLVFCGAHGQPFRRASLYTAWYRALKVVGIEGLRIHDLRHTGNTLAAMTGASTKELMARMGHASPRAALIYQHATSGRDKAIADALDRMIRSADPAERGRSVSD